MKASDTAYAELAVTTNFSSPIRNTSAHSSVPSGTDALLQLPLFTMPSLSSIRKNSPPLWKDDNQRTISPVDPDYLDQGKIIADIFARSHFSNGLIAKPGVCDHGLQRKAELQEAARP